MLPLVFLDITSLSLSCSYKEIPVYDLSNYITNNGVENAQARAPGCGNYIMKTKTSKKNLNGACHFPLTI